MDNINKLLEKYWDGVTSLEEERIIKEYYLHNTHEGKNNNISQLFSFFNEEKNIKFNREISILTQNKKGAIVARIKLITKIAVAASILLAVGFATFQSENIFTNDNSYAKIEIKDQKEAREIAERAIAMLASNYAKGEKTLTKSMKNLEKVNIINSLIKTN